jgi:hypothetical protein
VNLPIPLTRNREKVIAAVNDNDTHFVFTEATANAYKEWNVVKKNKFGRRQERIFGVDGKRVYNGKRGQLKGNTTGVQRGEREIETIVKIEILNNDKRTFRIAWMDVRDVYNIEYTCDNERETAEIVAKIKYIMHRNVKGKKTTTITK